MTDTPESTPAKLQPTADLHTWFEQHVRLTYDFATDIVRASLASTDAARAAANRSHEALVKHAELVLGQHAPVVLAKNGVHTIPYRTLAEARAKVRSLQAEVALLQRQLAEGRP